MLKSHPISVAIRRPYQEVYDFLTDPLNFARWAAVPDSMMEPMGGDEWLVEIPRGRAIMRFSPRNPYGVLDYSVRLVAGGPQTTTPVRLLANEEGADLVLFWVQRPGVDDVQFVSEIDWIVSDLERLKSLLEAG